MASKQARKCSKLIDVFPDPKLIPKYTLNSNGNSLKSLKQFSIKT